MSMLFIDKVPNAVNNQSIYLAGKSKKIVLSAFADILANFLLEFYTTIKQENIHFTTNFCLNISENN